MYKVFIVSIMSMLVLSGCGSAGMPGSNEARIAAALEKHEVVRGEVVNSVANFRITGWHAINNRNLILTAGVHDHYLVSLATPCLDLDFAVSIALDTRTSLLSRGDDVIVNSLHRPMERCQIMTITRLVDREGAQE